MSDCEQIKNADRALIIGCGYLGQVFAKHLVRRELYSEVYGVVRSEHSSQTLANIGVRAIMADVTQALSLSTIRCALKVGGVDVFYMIPPGRQNAINTIQTGIRNTMQILNNAGKVVRKAILVSSTAVYSQSNGEWVNTESETVPTSERTKALIDGEACWLAGGDQFSVLRLAGIYGPKRIIGLSAVRSGSPLIGNVDAWLNLIHVNDAAELLLAMTQCQTASRIEIGCDGEPIKRMEYYTALANLISVPPPEAVDDETAAKQFGLNIERLKRSASKRLSNEGTKQRTGWEPRFTNFVEGVRESLIASKR